VHKSIRGAPPLARAIADLASAPIENFVTEFMPDVARRIHLRVVLFQRIIIRWPKRLEQGRRGAFGLLIDIF